MFEFKKHPRHNTLLHAGFHKCLTVYFKRVLQCMGSLHSLERIKLSPYELDHGRLRSLRDEFSKSTLVFHVDNVTDGTRKEFFSGIKGSHFIRDPRDLVISAAHYHHICSEKWCQKEVSRVLSQPKINTLVRSYSIRQPEECDTYQSYLQKHSIEESFIIELFRMTRVFKGLKDWDYSNPDIIELKYEDIVGDEKNAFKRIFRHYGLPRSWVRTGIKCAGKLALGKKDGDIRHVRSGKTAQWKKEFSPQMEEIFKEHQGDLLIHLGYEKDFNW